jgi:SAM-dependent methyltransferase
VTPVLARVLDADSRHCVVAFLADGRLEAVSLSADIFRNGIPVTAGHLVLVDDGVVVFRGPLAESVRPDELDTIRERCMAEWRALTARGIGSRDPRRIVADGYNRIAERYAQWTRDEVIDETRPRYLSLLLESLPSGADLLELGCGGGGPTTARLARRFKLTGVDISERQIDLARQSVPDATFLCDDMTRVAFPSASFDGVASFYAFNHLPSGELPRLMVRIADWLRLGGMLVAALARSVDPGTVEPDWLGAPMYFSGYSPDESRSFAEAARLSIISLQPEPIVENGHTTEFLWLVARKV